MFSQELRLVSNGDGKLDWTVGAYFRDLERATTSGFEFEFSDFLPEVFGPGFALQDKQERLSISKSKSLAFYVEGNYALSDEFSLTAGGRYFKEDRDFFAEEFYASFIFGTTPGVIIDDSSDDSAFSPNFILSWTPNDDITAFARVSKGFRSGGINANSALDAVIPQSYGPENLWSYEAGLKTNPTDKLIFNLYAYYSEWDDLQLVFREGFLAYLANAGTVEVTGAEAEVFAKVTDRFRITWVASYTSTEVVDQGNSIQPILGNKVPFVPKFTSNLIADYLLPLSERLDGFIYADYSYRSSSYSDHPASHLVGLRMGVMTDRWQASLFVSNLLDRDDTTLRANPVASSPFVEFNYVRPRTIGLEFRANF
jgi:outer membrane receptor protein involved in Fe transport